MLDVPFNPGIGVGLRLVEMSADGVGCVDSLRAMPVSPEAGYNAYVDVISPIGPNGDQCQGGQGLYKHLLLVRTYDNPDSPSTPTELHAPVTISALPWFPGENVIIEAIPGAIPAPISLQSEFQTATLDTTGSPAWLITLTGVGDGFVVPIFHGVNLPSETWLSLRHNTEPGGGESSTAGSFTEGESVGGYPMWAAACGREACDLGWELRLASAEVPPSFSGSVSWSWELWAFDTDPDLSIDVQLCRTTPDTRDQILCSPSG